MNFKMLFKDKKLVMVLFSLVVLTLSLRLVGIDKQDGLGYDECLSYDAAIQSFPFGVIKGSIHAPLYFLILRVWMEIFGRADLVIRLLSVLFSLLSIPVLYFAGSELEEKTEKISNIGIITALLAASNSLYIYYSQEVRFYSLLILASALVLLFFLKFLNNPNRKNFIYLTLSNLLLIGSYILGVAFVFIEILMLLVYFYFKKRELFSKIFKINLVIVAIILCIMPFLLYVPLSKIINHSDRVGLYLDVFSFDSQSLVLIFKNWCSPVLDGLGFVVSNYLQGFQRDYPYFYKQQFFYFSLIVPMFIYLLGISRALFQRRSEDKRIYLVVLIPLLFLALNIIATILGYYVLITRYTLIGLPFLFLIVAYGLSKFKFKEILILYIVMLHVYYILFSPLSAAKMERPEGIKLAANLLNKYNFDKRDILLESLLLSDLYPYYLSDVRRRSLTLDFLFTHIKSKDSNEIKKIISSVGYSKDFEDFLVDNYFSKIQKGRYFIIVRNINWATCSQEDLLNIVKDEKAYNGYSKLFMLLSKYTMDAVKISEKHLYPYSFERDFPWEVYIYKK